MTAILKVDTIQDTSGNNIINESSDTITIGASGDTTNIIGTLQNNGSAVASTNGITMAEQWRLSTSLACNTLNTTTDVTANLEKADTDGAGTIGSSMSESSGVFTFPSTGIYLITNNFQFFTAAGGSPFHGLMLRTTTNNSSYSYATENYVMISSNYNNGANTFMFDVTDTSTHKVKFSYYVNGATILKGASDVNYTHFTFIRLGDT